MQDNEKNRAKFDGMAKALGINAHLDRAIESTRAAMRIIETVNAAIIADGSDEPQADVNGVLSYIIEAALPDANARAAVAVVTLLAGPHATGADTVGRAFEISLACSTRMPHQVLTAVGVAFDRHAAQRAAASGDAPMDTDGILCAGTREDAKAMLRGIASNGNADPAEGV